MVNNFFRCPNTNTSSGKHILAHFQTFHKSKDDLQGAYFKCVICQTEFNNLYLLKQHIYVKHVNEYCKFRCDFCNFGGEKKAVIQEHKLEKHPELPHFLCKSCNVNIFFTQVDLDHHR